MSYLRSLDHKSRELLEIIAKFPQGASIDALLHGLKAPIPKRTLQYKLAHLIKTGFVKNTGKTKSSKYILVERSIDHDSSMQSFIPDGVKPCTLRPGI